VHQSLIASLKRARYSKQRQAILSNAPDSFIRYLRNLTQRLVSGKVRVNSTQRKRLLPYGKKLIQVAKLKQLNQLRRRVSTGGKSQKGGILPIIPFLLGLGPLLAKGLAVGAATAAGSFAVKKALGSSNNEPVPQTGSGAYRRNQHYYC
jgi:VIT1/CCC1 family predicted Fe2+/Mn2+ transporter